MYERPSSRRTWAKFQALLTICWLVLDMDHQSWEMPYRSKAALAMTIGMAAPLSVEQAWAVGSGFAPGGFPPIWTSDGGGWVRCALASRLPNALQKAIGGLVIGVLGDETTLEGTFQDALTKPIGSLQVGLNLG